MDVRIAGTARPASWLVPEFVPPLNSPTARRTDYDTTGPRAVDFQSSGDLLFLAGPTFFAFWWFMNLRVGKSGKKEWVIS